MAASKGSKKKKPLSLPVKILVFGGYILFASILLIAFCTGAGPYDIPTASRSLDDVIATSQSYGLPLTEAEAEDHVPDEANAALVVMPIAAILAVEGGQHLRSAMSSRTPLDETIGTARTVIQSTSLRLDKIQKELEEKHGWFIDKDLELGASLTFSEVTEMRNVGDMFRCRAYLRAMDGDVEGALSDLTSCRKIALHQSKQFMIIGLLSGASSDVRALYTTVLIAHLWQSDEAALKRLREWLSNSYTPIDPRPAFRQEFYNGVAIMRNLSNYGGLKVLFGYYHEEFVFDSKGLNRSGLPKRMWERAILARFAEIYNAGYGPIKDDPHPPFGWTEPITELYESFKMVGNANYPPSFSGAYAQMLIPVISQVDAGLIRVDARQVLAEATVDVLLYKLRSGALPATLKDLEASYTDPFNNKPLNYRQTADGFRIWSVNDNRKDDGGIARGEKSGVDWDVVVIYPPNIEENPISLP